MQEQSAGGKETPAIEIGRVRTTYRSSRPVRDENDASSIGVIAEVNLQAWCQPRSGGLVPSAALEAAEKKGAADADCVSHVAIIC